MSVSLVAYDKRTIAAERGEGTRVSPEASKVWKHEQQYSMKESTLADEARKNDVVQAFSEGVKQI